MEEYTSPSSISYISGGKRKRRLESADSLKVIVDEKEALEEALLSLGSYKRGNAERIESESHAAAVTFRTHDGRWAAIDMSGLSLYRVRREGKTLYLAISDSALKEALS